MPVETEAIRKGATSTIRISLGLVGLVSAIIGILILVWPGRTAMVAVALISVYTIIAGLLYAAVGIFSMTKGGWARAGHTALGILFVAAGVFMLVNLGAATAGLAAVLGVLVGILWIGEGVVSLSNLGQASSRLWTIIFAALNIIAGVVLLFSPLYISVLWWLLGLSLLVMGVIQIVWALSFGRGGIRQEERRLA
ncbi:MAG TPA: DUF308 domain-containing protein [Actinomycetaceae bacterium]|nr:DUF308 domain-containing protein [Actinomycetaceae bacterium]